MSDEVSQFLEQVERLRGQQIEEDETRARELEEYLAAKRERQARREGEKRTKKQRRKRAWAPIVACSLTPVREALLLALMAFPLPISRATSSVVHPLFTFRCCILILLAYPWFCLGFGMH
jgi:hypothetical protein